VLLLIVTLPHLFGLFSTQAAEGYTSELVQGEDQSLQVAYPAYREAVQWLATHTTGEAKVGLVALPGTLVGDGGGLTWFESNKDLPHRLHLSEVLPNSASFLQDYLIWPMHLQQRGSLPPLPWRAHLLHTINGGTTTYCLILGRQ
jgi:hypothetical protein